MRFSPVLGIAVVAAAVSSFTPKSARACGGTFCDNSGPRAMPVDQTGENIIFVMEPGQVEAHIQIQYRGEAPRFSWIVPVQALPDIQVGSEALFDRVLAATVPTFGFQMQFDTCDNANGGVSTKGGFGTGAGGGSNGAPGSGPTVVLQKVVGAFDVTVLMGGTAAEVTAWLDSNGYQTPPNATQLLDGYVMRGFFFVAVKLTGGAGLDEIHPLVLRYAGTSPCVPIKLTAVAAVEDMGVRTFFLGTKRVVPKNYKHVVPNPVRLDWATAGSNYNQLVGRAADSPVADGHAFVTEYAGPAAIVGAGAIGSPSWNATPFFTASPVDVIDLLQKQGLVSCSGGYCDYQHPLLLPLLREYLPAPATLPPSPDVPSGISDPSTIEGYFYGCLSCYRSSINANKWNGPAFASALASRIVDPSRHADELIANWPYLTRMFTTISPAEMTEDPEFQERGDLKTVAASGSGTLRVTCSGSRAMTLPDGRLVALTPQQTWPAFSDQMPWAERIEDLSVSGEPVVLVDNTERINSQLLAWNSPQGWMGYRASDISQSTSGGCGCRTSPSSPGSPFALALLGLAAAFRRRGAFWKRRLA
jgi:MYXO-CTERM domain-containing protein